MTSTEISYINWKYDFVNVSTFHADHFEENENITVSQLSNGNIEVKTEGVNQGIYAWRHIVIPDPSPHHAGKIIFEIECKYTRIAKVQFGLINATGSGVFSFNFGSTTSEVQSHGETDSTIVPEWNEAEYNVFQIHIIRSQYQQTTVCYTVSFYVNGRLIHCYRKYKYAGYFDKIKPFISLSGGGSGQWAALKVAALKLYRG